MKGPTTVQVAELDNQLHTLEHQDGETYTTCGQDLDPKALPRYLGPDGKKWRPKDHQNPCAECFPRLKPTKPAKSAKPTANGVVKDGQHPCPKCERHFETEHGCRVHVARSHKDVKLATVPAKNSKYDGIAAGRLQREPAKVETFRCDIGDCQQVFGTPSQLSGHKSGHARRKKAQVVPPARSLPAQPPEAQANDERQGDLDALIAAERERLDKLQLLQDLRRQADELQAQLVTA